jgi:hypothetical protein
MITLELEYFFLCSGRTDGCHSPQGVRPIAPPQSKWDRTPEGLTRESGVKVRGVVL